MALKKNLLKVLKIVYVPTSLSILGFSIKYYIFWSLGTMFLQLFWKITIIRRINVGNPNSSHNGTTLYHQTHVENTKTYLDGIKMWLVVSPNAIVGNMQHFSSIHIEAGEDVGSSVDILSDSGFGPRMKCGFADPGRNNKCLFSFTTEDTTPRQLEIYIRLCTSIWEESILLSLYYYTFFKANIHFMPFSHCLGSAQTMFSPSIYP